MKFKKQHIKTSVVGCILDAQQRVLLTRRCIEPFCSQWVMPGGKIDHGEAILEALHREIAEEVGIEVQVEGLIDVFEHVGVGTGQDHYVIIYYRCHFRSGDLKPNGSECTEAVWFSAGELVELDLPPGCRHILGKVFPEFCSPVPAPNTDLAGEIPDQMTAP